MNHWILKSLLLLAITVAMVPYAHRAIDRQCHVNQASETCAGGSCGNFRATQELLDRNTIRFSQSVDTQSIETSP